VTSAAGDVESQPAPVKQQVASGNPVDSAFGSAPVEQQETVSGDSGGEDDIGLPLPQQGLVTADTASKVSKASPVQGPLAGPDSPAVQSSHEGVSTPSGVEGTALSTAASTTGTPVGGRASQDSKASGSAESSTFGEAGSASADTGSTSGEGGSALVQKESNTATDGSAAGTTGPASATVLVAGPAEVAEEKQVSLAEVMSAPVLVDAPERHSAGRPTKRRE
jgi:hypothetical protein